MIEVTLEHMGKHVDLVVPGEVTFDRLAELIRDGFAAKGTALPADFSLSLDDKALDVSGYDAVSSFGIGNGDRLRIVV
ncbi:MAG: hypothetical protein QM621_10610 [Aeromicrobium sp.]|uniref:hypothetical protein n=1 Tax=Aeromicrobium sp. TaxID=1871063 RepID=UPI0039E2DA6A